MQREAAGKAVEGERKAENVASFRSQRQATQSLHPILQLQQLAGNRAVGRFLQAKLRVGQPGDIHEREADRVADQVMRMSDPHAGDGPDLAQPDGVQIRLACRQCEERLGKPSDEEKLRRKGRPGPELPTGSSAPDERSLSSGGKPLPSGIRTFYEDRFNRDFSQVRVHTGPLAERYNDDLHAYAFTYGHHVWMGRGQIVQPSLLLAHELAHVVQQSHAPMRGDTGLIPATKPPEVQRKEFNPAAVPVNNLSNLELAEEIEKTEQYLEKYKNVYVVNPTVYDAARDNLKTLLAERAARNITSPLAEGRRETWQEGEAVSKLGIVQVDEGAWFYTSMKSVPFKRLRLNELVAVERVIPGNWYLIITKEGNPGYVDAADINTSMPDPEAKLYRIQPGDTAQGIVKKFYSGFRYSEDQRYYVNVLVLVNHQAKRPGIKNKTLDAPEGGGKADVDWEASQVFSGMQIWIPGQSYAKSLRGKIPTGSISYDAFTAVVDFISDVGEFLLGSVAFIAGLLHGALESLWDVLVGLVDLIKMVYSLIKSIVLGEIINDIGSLWDTLKKIKLSDIFDAVQDWLDKKWNQPGTWDRWHFRGWLIGYIVMEIVFLVASDGIITALKWVGKSAKIAKLVEKIPMLAKAVKRVEELKTAGKLTEVIKGTKVVEGLVKARKWAQDVLAIPLEILELLTEETIGRLKKLPAWAMERFRELNAAAMRLVLGCASPCKVKLDEIITFLSEISKSGKGGKVISDISEMLAALPKGMDLTLIKDKLTRFPGIMAAIKEAGFTAEDFGKIGAFLTDADKLNPETAYKTFTRYLSYAVPSKTGKDIGKLNKIFDAMMQAEGSSVAARSLKGSIFEAFAATHLPEFAGKSLKGVEFTSTGGLILTKGRTPDFFLDATGELWDLKTSLKHDPKQLADYIKILNHTEPGLPKVTSINYLFSSKELAEANRKIKDAGALVHYVDTAGKIVPLL
jgi:hypothetical protein